MFDLDLRMVDCFSKDNAEDIGIVLPTDAISRYDSLTDTRTSDNLKLISLRNKTHISCARNRHFLRQCSSRCYSASRWRHHLQRETSWNRSLEKKLIGKQGNK